MFFYLDFRLNHSGHFYISIESKRNENYKLLWSIYITMILTNNDKKKVDQSSSLIFKLYISFFIGCEE